MAQRRVDVVVRGKRAIGENGAPVAVLPNGFLIVRRQDDVGAAHALAEGLRAFAAKPPVADLDNFVDQNDVEIDRQAGGKAEPRPHAGGIGIDRHLEIFAKLGKGGDIFASGADGGAVKAG